MLSYGSRIGSGVRLWCYRHVPGLAPAARFAYRFVAGHRTLASVLTRRSGEKVNSLFAGPPITMRATWFLRLLGIDLPHRILVLLEPGRRIDRSRRHSARGALVRRAAKSVRDRSVPNLPDALLVQRQRFVPAFVVRQRSGTESVAHSADRAAFLSASIVVPLSLAERGGPGLYELPMGLPAFGSWLSQHLPGAIPTPSIAALIKVQSPPGRIFYSAGSCSDSCSCPAW